MLPLLYPSILKTVEHSLKIKFRIESPKQIREAISGRRDFSASAIEAETGWLWEWGELKHNVMMCVQKCLNEAVPFVF